MKSVNVAKKFFNPKAKSLTVCCGTISNVFWGFTIFYWVGSKLNWYLLQYQAFHFNFHSENQLYYSGHTCLLEIFPQKHVFLWKYLSNEMPKVIEFRKKLLVSCLARLSSFRHFPSAYFRQKVPIANYVASVLFCKTWFDGYPKGYYLCLCS